VGASPEVHNYLAITMFTRLGEIEGGGCHQSDKGRPKFAYHHARVSCIQWYLDFSLILLN
jgi:hypothetical protein